MTAEGMPVDPRIARRRLRHSTPTGKSCAMSTEDAPLPAAPKIDGPSPHLLIIRAPYYKGVVDGLTVGRRADPARSRRDQRNSGYRRRL